MTPARRIISASRRTDIPAFHTPWFLRRIAAGFCHTINPFGGQVYEVDLRPEAVVALVFWTRNPRPLMSHLQGLRESGYRFYFQFTINGYGDWLETHNPSLEAALTAFRQLAELIGPDHVRWRYDPIVLSSRTPAEFHMDRFTEISGAVSGFTRHGTISFVDFYGKTDRNLRKVSLEHGVQFQRPTNEEKQTLAGTLARIARDAGIALHSCCDDSLLTQDLARSACVDGELIRSLTPEHRAAARPTRRDCGCVESIDIGAYDTCAFGCSYCYATNSRKAAIGRLARCQRDDTALWRPSTLAGEDLAVHVQKR